MVTLFFQKENKNSLYYAGSISREITNNDVVKNGLGLKWRTNVSEMSISPPTFLSKDKQKIKWSNKITCKVEAVKENAPLFNFLGNQYPDAFNKVDYFNPLKKGGALLNLSDAPIIGSTNFMESLNLSPSPTLMPYV